MTIYMSTLFWCTSTHADLITQIYNELSIMYSRWISIFFFLFAVTTSCCNGQARAPTRNVPRRPTVPHERTSGSKGNRLITKPQDTRTVFIKKIDELHTALETQKNVFVTHKKDFDNHIDSFERRFSMLSQRMIELTSKMQVLLKKNIDLQNQLKTINDQFVLVPKENLYIPENDDQRGNSTGAQARSVSSKSTVEDYLSNRGAELIELLPPQPKPQKQMVSQRTTTSARSRGGKPKTFLVNNNSLNKQQDYVSDAMIRLFAQDKHANDRLMTLESQIKTFDLTESVTTTIIVEACNETDSSTEILELKDMEKRVRDLEKHIKMNNINNYNADYDLNIGDLKEEQTNKIGLGQVEARGKKKYKNEVFDARAASDARKSLFSAARTTAFYGSDKESIITFNHTYVNKGKHFINNSTFACRLGGFYFFTFTIRSLDHYTTYVTLMKNRDAQTSISADASQRNIMQSQSTILQLNELDEVWLRVGPNSNYALDSEERNKYITFTGFLIYKGS